MSSSCRDLTREVGDRGQPSRPRERVPLVEDRDANEMANEMECNKSNKAKERRELMIACRAASHSHPPRLSKSTATTPTTMDRSVAAVNYTCVAYIIMTNLWCIQCHELQVLRISTRTTRTSTSKLLLLRIRSF